MATGVPATKGKKYAKPPRESGGEGGEGRSWGGQEYGHGTSHTKYHTPRFGEYRGLVHATYSYSMVTKCTRTYY